MLNDKRLILGQVNHCAICLCLCASRFRRQRAKVNLLAISGNAQYFYIDDGEIMDQLMMVFVPVLLIICAGVVWLAIEISKDK